MSSDEKFILHCLSLAAKGLGSVAPNPMVGAAFVLNDTIFGEGYHQHWGGPHAEVNALSSLSDTSVLARGTLYVSLEPCCHHGKTPPCTDLILQKHITRVVFGCVDPFPKVAGRGAEVLRAAGVTVISDVLKDECIELNRRFFTAQILSRPYVILKWAQTADGFLARKDFSSKWISSEASRTLVHQWRSEEQAVLVGYRTAYYDNPYLTSRLPCARQPVRAAVDYERTLPQSHNLFNKDSNTLIFTSKQSEIQDNIEWISLSGTRQTLVMEVLHELQRRGIQSVIVEGGAALLRAFIEAEVWDEARVFQAAKEFEEGIPAPTLARSPSEERIIDGDRLSVYKVRRFQLPR